MKTRIAVAFILLTTPIASAQKVDVSADPSAPFPFYRTYAWVQGTPLPTPLGERRFHLAVDAQLAARNLTKVAAAPDVFVATHVVSQPRSQVLANGFGWGRGAGATSVEQYEPGTLVVDLYDARTRQLVWRGAGTGINRDTADRYNVGFHQALNRMFEKYPAASLAAAAASAAPAR